MECAIKIVLIEKYDHRQVVRDWIVASYRKAGSNLTEDRGGHYVEVRALSCADKAIDPVHLNAIEESIPYSQTAFDLKNRAVTESQPLSILVFRA